MKLIKLTQGFFAIVDDEDFEYLNQWKWCVHKYKSKREKKCRYYAERGERYGPRCENKFRHIRMHRLLLGVTSKDILVDHKNGNGLDNRRFNIRTANPTQNSQNAVKKVSKRNTSCYKGAIVKYTQVTKGKIYYESRIKLNKKSIFLGCFHNELSAAKAYDRAALKYFGDFAKTNFEYQDKFGLRFKLNPHQSQLMLKR